MEVVGREKKEGQSSVESGAALTGLGVENVPSDSASGGIAVSFFEDSVEKFISTMDAISLLCGTQDGTFDQHELRRLSHTIRFLK